MMDLNPLAECILLRLIIYFIDFQKREDDVENWLYHFRHISDQGVVKAINVKKMTSSGCKVKIWIADLFARLNNKMGGDMNKI